MRFRVAFALTLLGLAPARASAGPAVTIDGDSLCPTPTEVALRVTALLPANDPLAPIASARVDRVGSELRVRMIDQSGAPIAERTLPGAGGCIELADVVAVTITSWVSQLRPERLPAPQIPAPGAPAPARSRAGIDVDVGAGALMSMGEGALAVGATVQLFAHLGRFGPGLHLRATGTTAREVAIGDHRAEWKRWAISGGPSFQFPVGKWRLATAVGFSAGWLSAAGKDFPKNESDVRFSPGVSGLVRLAYPFARWAPWMSLGASAALREEPLIVVDSLERRALRPIDLEACAGISFGTFP